MSQSPLLARRVMRRKNATVMLRRVLSLACAMPLAFMLPGAGLAAEPAALSPAPAAAAPPRMPAAFDKATVQRLIDGIELDHNAAVLKVGYFLQRGAAKLPLSEGFALLNAARLREKPGANRWYLLQMVHAFAACNASRATQAQGYLLYGELWSQAALAPAPAMDGAVQRAVADFFGFVQSDLYASSAGGIKSSDLLFKALALHLEYLKRVPAAPFKSMWAGALWRTGLGSKRMLELVEPLLADPQAHQSYALLLWAAQAFSSEQTQRSLELAEEARRLLPPQDTELHDYVQQFCVRLLERNSQKPPPSILNQQQYVQRTGRGYAHLVWLQRHHDDAAGLAQTYDALAGSDVADEEVAATAAMLFEQAQTRQKGAMDQALQLLTRYLDAPRVRAPQQEMYARLQLGGLWHSDGELAKALAVLTAAPPAAAMNTMTAQRYHAAAMRLQTTVRAELAEQGKRP